ncbi:unnamed protein product [Caenorhabditis auriculariae]|uniref:Uncharacterized protein n=1 Tax=Caenorhabditis auriculariae TaxID=2777116 RepID=A0A8S1HAA9_9PELO|nr:unnamed protein product [Caenorhabditis auriculariae]
MYVRTELRSQTRRPERRKRDAPKAEAVWRLSEPPTPINNALLHYWSIGAQMAEKPIEYWLSRATDPYLGIKRKARADGASVAIEILAHKVVSPDQDEALYSLQTVDALARRCGEKVHIRLGRYRFLNQLVKIITPKYLGAQTSQEVKNFAIKLLYTWQRSIKHIGKFKEVYDSLREHNLITEDPSIPEEEIAIAPSTPRSAVFEDEEKSRVLKQLLSSGSPEDLQAANRMIKNLVRTEEQKIAKVHQRNGDLDAASKLCRKIEECVVAKAAQSLGLVDGDIEDVKKLYDDLISIRPTLYRYAGELAETEDPALVQVLEVNDYVNKIIRKYGAELAGKHKNRTPSTNELDSRSLVESEMLLDLANVEPITSSPIVNERSENFEELLEAQYPVPEEQPDVPFIGFEKNMTPVLPRRSGQKSVDSRRLLEKNVKPLFDVGIFEENTNHTFSEPKKPTLNELCHSGATSSAFLLDQLDSAFPVTSSSKTIHHDNGYFRTPANIFPETITFDPNQVELDFRDPVVILDKEYIRVVLYWTKLDPKSLIRSFIISASNVHVETLHDVRLTMWTTDQKCAFDLPGFSLAHQKSEPTNRMMCVLPIGEVIEAEIDFSISFTHHFERTITGSFTLKFK